MPLFFSAVSIPGGQNERPYDFAHDSQRDLIAALRRDATVILFAPTDFSCFAGTRRVAFRRAAAASFTTR